MQGGKLSSDASVMCPDSPERICTIARQQPPACWGCCCLNCAGLQDSLPPLIQAINAQKETLDIQASTALKQMKELLRALEQMSLQADRTIALRVAAYRPGASSQTSGLRAPSDDLLSAQNSCESIASVLKEVAGSLGTAVQQAESTVGDLARIRTSLNLPEEWEQPLQQHLKNVLEGKLKEAQGLHRTASSECMALAEKLTAAVKDAGETVAGGAD